MQLNNLRIFHFFALYDGTIWHVLNKRIRLKSKSPQAPSFLLHLPASCHRDILARHNLQWRTLSAYGQIRTFSSECGSGGGEIIITFTLRKGDNSIAQWNPLSQEADERVAQKRRTWNTFQQSIIATMLRGHDWRAISQRCIGLDFI